MTSPALPNSEDALDGFTRSVFIEIKDASGGICRAHPAITDFSLYEVVPDTDGDGIDDVDDDCPTVAAVDDADSNGCPDGVDVFALDDDSFWSIGTTVSSPSTEGDGALAVTAVGWTAMKSDSFTGDAVDATGTLALDVFVPDDPPSPRVRR